MFSGIRRLVGSISVKQRANEVLVEGVPASVMVKDIAKIWKTSKISMHMFNRLGNSSFSFNTFFASQIVYMLDVMIETRGTGVSKRVLRNIQTEIINNTYLINTLPETHVPDALNYDMLKKLVHQPLPHQMNWLKQYNTKKTRHAMYGDVLAADPGTGKTLASIQMAECAEADLVIVVAPKIAVHKPWGETLSTCHKIPEAYWIYADGKPYKGERWVVAHYQSLIHILEMVKSGELKGNKIAIILDESHNLNESVSLQSQLFVELCKATGSKDIVWMSGTPIKALGAEMIPMLRTLTPLFTKDTEERFRKIFGKDTSKALDIISHLFGFISFRVEKKEMKLQDPIWVSVGVKVPDGHRYTLKSIKLDMEKFINERFKYYKERKPADEKFFYDCLKMHEATLKTPSQQKAYSEYQRVLKVVIKIGDPRFCGEEIKASNAYEKGQILPSLPQALRNQFKDIKSIVKYLKLKIQGECLGRVLGRFRIECAVAMTQNIDFVELCDSTEKKTVVFTSFVEALRETDAQCRKAGLTPILVYGATNNELAQTVTRFGKEAEINPLAATFQSLSTAVPLVMADTMGLINSPFRAYILEQAVARIHRLGQDSQTTIYKYWLDTGTEPNISTRSNDILKWSQDQVNAILGIETPFKLDENVGLEAFKTKELEYDEAKHMRAVINHSLEDYDIVVSNEDFAAPKVTRPSIYAW